MFSSKVFLICLLAAVAYGKVVNVKNGRSSTIMVSVDDSVHTVPASSMVSVPLPDDWSGSITALPEGSEVTDGPKTKVVLSLGFPDSYYVSMMDGFNCPVKVMPNGSTNCNASLCAANINVLCPSDKQVHNSLGTVVACHNSPLVMGTVCPLAVVSADTAVNVQNCSTATSYMVLYF